MFAFCFSSNNFSDDLELVKDLDGLDELWDFELFLDFQDLEDKDDLGLLSFDWELRWVFDGIFLWKGFRKLCSYRVSKSLHSSRKLSTVLVISITRNSWLLKTFIALSISSGSIKSLQYSWLLLLVFSKMSSNFDNECLILMSYYYRSRILNPALNR